MIDEPVSLAAYNSAWPQHFMQERDRIQAALKFEAVAIEHIGSTAIPGLYAKPIVDIMIGLVAVPPSQHVADGLVNLGYEAFGEAGVPGRFYFRYRSSASFNVHVVAWKGNHWLSNLALRDYLRSDPEAAKEYANVKIAAVQSGATQLLKYSEVKSAFVEQLVCRAVEWMLAAGDS